MNDFPHLVKYTSKDCRCDKCNGGAMIDGETRLRLPVGFGFKPGQSGFCVDSVEYKGWSGECMDCGRKLLFWKSRKQVTKKPRSINRKLSR